MVDVSLCPHHHLTGRDGLPTGTASPGMPEQSAVEPKKTQVRRGQQLPMRTLQGGITFAFFPPTDSESDLYYNLLTPLGTACVHQRTKYIKQIGRAHV